MALTTTPGTGNLTGYPVLYSPTDLANQVKAKIDDFRVNIKYSIARQVGMAYMGLDSQTPAQPIWEPRYELYDRYVRESTINQDLMDFQQQIKKGNAYAVTAVAAPPALLLEKEGEVSSYSNVKELSRDEALEDLQAERLAPDPNTRPNYVFPEDVGSPAASALTEEQEIKNIEAAKKEENKKLGEQQKARAEALKGETFSKTTVPEPVKEKNGHGKK